MLIVYNFLYPYAFPPNCSAFIKGFASNRKPPVRADKPKGLVKKRFLCSG
jgi:hypothetical protein